MDETKDPRFRAVVEEEGDGKVFGLPIALQMLLQMTDCYNASLCTAMNHVDELVSRETDMIQLCTALCSIAPTYWYHKAKSFHIPVKFPPPDKFFARLVNSWRFRAQVYLLLKNRRELFEITEEEVTTKAIQEWRKVQEEISNFLDEKFPDQE